MSKRKCKFCLKTATRFADIELKPHIEAIHFIGLTKVFTCDDHIKTMEIFFIPNDSSIAKGSIEAC